MPKLTIAIFCMIALIFISKFSEANSFFKKEPYIIDSTYQDTTFGGKNQLSLTITFTPGDQLIDPGDYAVIVDVDGDGDFSDEPATSYVETGTATPDKPTLVIWDISKSLSSLRDGTYYIGVVIDNHSNTSSKKATTSKTTDNTAIEWGDLAELTRITSSVNTLVQNLEDGIFSDALRTAVDPDNTILSGNITVSDSNESNSWKINDSDKEKRYLFKKVGSNLLIFYQEIERDESFKQFTLDRILTISKTAVDPTAFSPNGDGVKDKINIGYNLTESLYSTDSDMTITVGEGKLGVPINLIPSKQQGYNVIYWDGTDELKRYVPDGDYPIKIYARDPGGNESTSIITVKIRTIPPSIDAISPADSSFTANFAEIVAQYKDNSGEGLDLSNSILQLYDSSENKINGTQIIDGTNKLKLKLSSPLPRDSSKDGKYTIKTTIYDKAGNSNTAIYNFYYDTTYPKIIYTIPSSGAILTAPPPSVVIALNDGNGVGIDFATTIKTFKVDGITTNGTVSHNGIDTLVFSPSAVFVKGIHLVELIPSDLSGNKPSQPIKFQFTVPEPPAVLSVSPTSLDLGTQIANGTFSITNTGSAKLVWSIKSDLPTWLSITPLNGETLATKSSPITLNITRGKLAQGTYSFDIMILSNGGDNSVKITMAVPVLPASMSVSPTSYDFGANMLKSSFIIENTGGSNLDWEIKADLPKWLKMSSMKDQIQSGGNSIITMSVDRQGLIAGSYKHKITITSNGGSGSVSIGMEVVEASLSIQPESLDYGESINENSVKLVNTGSGLLKWSISEYPTWLTIQPTKGEISSSQSAIIKLTAIRKDLKPNTYKDSVNISSNGGDKELPVSIKIAEPPPSLSLSTTILDFGDTNNNATFIISNKGGDWLNWNIDGDIPKWLNISDSKGELSSGNSITINLNVVRNELSSDKYTYYLSIASNGGNKSLMVTMNIPESPPTLSLSKASIDLSETDDSFALSNIGGGVLKWSLNSDIPTWLKVSNINGEIASNGISNVSLIVDRKSMKYGNYKQELKITSNGGNGIISVIISIPDPPPSIAVLNNSLDFGASIVEDSITISNAGGKILNWEIPSSLPNWLKVSPNKGEISSGEIFSIGVNVDRNGLARGIYKYSIPILSNDDNVKVTITMTVTESSPLIFLSSELLDFGKENTAISFSIVNKGGGTLVWQTENQIPEWLNISQKNGSVSTDSQSKISVTIIRDLMSSGNTTYKLPIISNGGNAEIAISAIVNRISLAINSDTNVGIGELFFVTIDSDKAEQLSGIKAEIAFDPSILEATQVEKGNFFSGSYILQWSEPKLDNKNGNISFGLSVTKIKDGNAGNSLIKIIFKAKNAGKSKLTLQNVNILDSDGIPIKASITNSQVNVNNAIYDINKDGMVDVIDLLLVANKMGMAITPSSTDRNSDINGDGVVNILDIAILCKHFSEPIIATAPNPKATKLDANQLAIIMNLYEIACNDSAIYAKELLEKLIAQNTSEIHESQLLQNYPNPSNPETWIPYKLSSSGIVIISIYSISGQLVQKINLGYKDEGDYTTRNRAAYWNGRNEAGEQVSSGVYIYSIKKDNFIATKKMIIQK